MNDFKTLVFDWSGTLVDDLPGVLKATNAVFRAFDHPEMTRPEFLDSFRLPYSGFYEEHLPGVDLEKIEDVFRGVFRNLDKSAKEVFLLSHAHEMLAWGKDQGYRLIVLSSMDEVALLEQAEDFGMADYFSEIHAGIADKRVVGHDLVKRFGTEGRLAFFGDMVHDVATARETGMTSVALLTGYDQAGRLSAELPDLILPDLAAFMRAFAR